MGKLDKIFDKANKLFDAYLAAKTKEDKNRLRRKFIDASHDYINNLEMERKTHRK